VRPVTPTNHQLLPLRPCSFLDSDLAVRRIALDGSKQRTIRNKMAAIGEGGHFDSALSLRTFITPLYNPHLYVGCL
jgi:hypothetical protein